MTERKNEPGGSDQRQEPDDPCERCLYSTEGGDCMGECMEELKRRIRKWKKDTEDKGPTEAR